MRTYFHYLFILLLFSGCQNKKEPQTTLFQSIAMTIPYRIIVGQELSTEERQKIEKVIQETFDEINAIYNKWNPHSEISKINRLPAYHSIKISPQLEKFLSKVNEIVSLSHGFFDPTIEPIQELWKKSLIQGKEPSLDQINHALSKVGWNKIHLANGILYKEKAEIKLDLGGIAKGYAVDLLMERLEMEGYHNLYVEWGGEIRTLGNHPAGRPWTIFISMLADTNPDNAVAHLSLSNQAIATSGDYLQYWTIKKNDSFEIYFHIFNPKTGFPLKMGPGSIASASVVASTCLMADAFATIAMLQPSIDDAKKWADEIKESHPEMQFWFVSRK